MIDADKRKAIFLLHSEGMNFAEISRQLRVSIGTVRNIVRSQGIAKKIVRSDRKEVSTEVLARLFSECDGYVQRVHERLKEENGIEIGYSTLTRLVKAHGLGEPTNQNRRDSMVPDEPGAEMQQDTSPYKLKIGGVAMHVVGSSLYLRYCKKRYIKFYPSFKRFQMKCFFHEALAHFEFCASICIIDNTNLAVLRGTGKNAVMVPEMIMFAEKYGFTWAAHEVNHSDRKAGVERSFWYIETNFFPGRNFSSLEDLNLQAFEWSTQRIPLKPHKKTKLIPAQLFELEKAYLKKIPAYVSPPVLEHDRDTDQHGYASLNGNFYWVPGEGRGHVKVLEFADKVRIFQNREMVAEYELPAWGIKNEHFKPKGVPDIRPRNSKQPTVAEERRLTAMGPEALTYLEDIKKLPLSRIKRNQLIRQLFRLSQKLAPEVFLKVVGRALHYAVHDIETLERMAVYLLRDGPYDTVAWEDESAPESDAHPELDVSDLPDLSKYDEQLVEEEDNGQGP
jgi:transposase